MTGPRRGWCCRIEGLSRRRSVALEGQRIGPLQFRVAAICLLMQTFDGYDLSSISMAAPALSQAWHLPGAAFANTVVMSSVGIMVGALASGPIGDRLGRKPVLLASLMLSMVSSLACVYATTIPILAALRLVTGLGIGTLMPATVALTSGYLPNRHRASMIMVVFTGAPLGGFLGGRLVSQLLSIYGWTSIFLIGCCTTDSMAVVQQHDRRPLSGACTQYRDGSGAGDRTIGRHRRPLTRWPVVGSGLVTPPGFSVRLRDGIGRRHYSGAVAIPGPAHWSVIVMARSVRTTYRGTCGDRWSGRIGP